MTLAAAAFFICGMTTGALCVALGIVIGSRP